ncbi:hypothetical protein AAFF_G00387690 [Aldrovandia affinis]|uniref:tRNA (adenine(58)-N(1))-methyltransferase n=1 Tax=Aldrovandia affinis TaxID=143900 RepID=A0AAD7WLE4_9TELE|nr:hypothetical protein AAFF_G00387690 [Aldrovandia affinis]
MGRHCWRLVQVWRTCGGQQGYRGLPLRGALLPHARGVRNFGLGDQGHSDGGSGSDIPESAHPSPQQLRPIRGLGSRLRSLSPLERVSRLLPPETLSQEVLELREDEQEEARQRVLGDMHQDEETSGTPVEVQRVWGERGTDTWQQEDRLNQRQEEEEERNDTGERVADSRDGVRVEDSSGSPEEKQHPAGGDPSHAPPGERPLCFGELALAEYHKKGRVEFRKMFPLQTGGCLRSLWGVVPHTAIVGRPAGSIILSSNGSPILLRRPSLEEYVLYMERGPAITYPKDANAMLLMMDVTNGDCVLECGSGSGAMSLFLSRAVGTQGSVLSVDKREDHHRRAVLNYRRWRSVWSVRRGEEWPDNVRFHNTDLVTATPLLAGQSFHSIALDMVRPELALPTLFPHLHNGAVCAIYLVNVTQVIDLLEGVRRTGLPLLCERVVEVQLRDWLLAPAGQRKDRFIPTRGNGDEEEAQPDDEEKEEPRHQGPKPFVTVPYIARPHPEQFSHTAFLVKLRKVAPVTSPQSHQE